MQIQQINNHRRELFTIANTGQLQAVKALSAVSSNVADAAIIAGAARRIAPTVATQVGEVAAVGAAMFYENANPNRNALRPVPAKPDLRALNEQVSWAVAPLFSTTVSSTVAVTELLRRYGLVIMSSIASADRKTIAQNAKRDTTWYRRYARPNACTYCKYMTTLGIDVLESYSKWHDNCFCVNVPWFEDNPFPVTDEMKAWEDLAAQAELRVLERREQVQADNRGMKSRALFAKHPEAVISPRNVVRQMRVLMK